MRFSFSEAFLKFFLEHQVIEFSDVFSSEEVDLFTKQVKFHLTQSLGKKPQNLASDLELWTAGHNLHLISQDIQKFLVKSPIGPIASELYLRAKKAPIRIAYTQTIFSKGTDLPFLTNHPLADISSVDPILGGAIICFQSHGEPSLSNLPHLTHQKKGNIFFFSKSYPIPFIDLFKQQNLECFLIGFAPSRIRYKLQPLDLHTHLLKKSGYVFGDLIEEKDCPYLCH